MKKMIVALILAAAAATPALASDGSETVMQSQPLGHATMWNGADSYAYAAAPRATAWRNGETNWQNANNGQWQAQSPISDR